LATNRDFRHKSKVWPKIEVIANNRNFDENQNFGQKSTFWSKIKILAKNSNLLPAIEILTTNQNVGQKSKLPFKHRSFGSHNVVIKIVKKYKK